MMSALQCIVLVAAILAIMTAIADEGNAYLCFSDRACQNLVTSVRILFAAICCTLTLHCVEALTFHNSFNNQYMELGQAL